MKVIGIIPARYKSIRFPGKPLTVIKGKTMIQRVYECASQASSLSSLYIATDDQKIYKHCKTFTENVLMTSPNCENGTERCAEVLNNLDDQFDCVINIQGDEPILVPEQIDHLIDLLKGDHQDISTLCYPLLEEEKDNHNVVKVALDKSDWAIGFSRDHEFIQNLSDRVYKHIGLYGFKSDTLKRIIQLQPTPNEQLEKLEQLRWVDHGYQIKVGITDHQNFSVDVKEDINKILAVLSEN